MNELELFRIGQQVRARRAIRDSPLSREDSSAKRGDVGTIEDVDTMNGWLIVDFGRGAILVDPDELA